MLVLCFGRSHLHGVRRPKGREAQDREDDRRRNDQVVQIGPERLAASAHVMGRPEDGAPHWDAERDAYQMLLVALIEAEREPPDAYRDVLGRTQRQQVII